MENVFTANSLETHPFCKRKRSWNTLDKATGNYGTSLLVLFHNCVAVNSLLHSINVQIDLGTPVNID
jgi:hypothetical protein